MKKVLTLIIMALTAMASEAQKVTFVSEGFERGVKLHLGLGDGEDVLQSQTDTITKIDLSSLEIRTVSDVTCLPNVEDLDLSNNYLTDVGPLSELVSLHKLNLRNNFLKDADKLAFSRSDKMMVDVANNYITDFTTLLFPGRCRFTLTGMNRQQKEEADEFDVLQLYVSVDSHDKVSVSYRGVTNMPASVTLTVGESTEIAVLDGSTYTVAVESSSRQAVKVEVSNGTYSDVTYVVPISYHSVKAGETVPIETGLPDTYRIDYAGALYGVVAVDGTMLSYTAPDEKTPDVISFIYCEGSRLRGYGRLFAGLQYGDVNADGSVSITDAVGIVNKILGNPSAGFIERAADVNRDSNISITDAVGVVNIILNSGSGASAPELELEDTEAQESSEVDEPE